jgi:hypothetical protein
MTEHLGYEKNGAGRDRESANIRNGSRSKTVISDAVGEVEVAVPRDREGTFSPAIVKKRQRRLGDVDEVVLSLYAKGLTTGEISAHFHDIYGASVSKETVSRITDAVIADMEEWSHRPLDPVYVAIFIDAIVVKVREGQVGERLAANYRANMHHSFDQELVPPGAAETLGCAPEGSEANIHSAQPGRCGHRTGRTGREMGWTVQRVNTPVA